MGDFKYVLIWLGIVALLVMSGVESTLLIALLSFILLALIGVPLAKKDKKKREAEQEVAEFTDVTGYSGYLTVHSRSPITRGAVNTYAVRDVTLNYTPDKYIYTSATVGGITTGGVSKIAGGYSTGLGDKTGTYNLWYKTAKRSTDSRNLTGWDGEVIYSIVLNDADFKKAKNNSMLRPLIVDQSKLKDGRLDSFSSERYLPNSLKVLDLSKYTADYVLSWICGEVDQNSSNENSNKNKGEVDQNSSNENSNKNKKDLQANIIKIEKKSAVEKSIERHNKKQG